MQRLKALADWLDDRTGYRTGKKHLLDEPIPAGVNWWFVAGSALMFLIGLQFLTGIVLTMYYVPSPEHAYDSVRFIMDRLPFGNIVRGLHYFGASFIVVASIVHMLRVVLFGSYKKPREVTWITGVVLLLIVLAFSLSGYLLPWDQKAYWATTVTINIARSTPFVGEQMAAILRGGLELGALTLGRWYSAHVFLLPLALIGFIVAHLYLMRRHGISGPVKPVPGPSRPFYPYHAVKDTVAIAFVFALLVTLVLTVPAPLDAIADPSDSTYVPRPEWYFLSLFQLLKYFPGPLEPVATMVIPGLVVGFLIALPFLDRGPDRDPRKRPLVLGAFGLLGVAVVALTYLGIKDTPAHADPARLGPLAIAGAHFAQDTRCQQCHVVGGPANPMSQMRLTRDAEWLMSHLADPEVIAPGVRPAPPGGLNRAQARAVVSYMRAVRAGAVLPQVDADTRTASIVHATRCASCHAIDGEGGTSGPDLSRVGAERDAAWLRKWIADPSEVDADAEMPAFGERLNDEQMTAIVNYLARRR